MKLPVRGRSRTAERSEQVDLLVLRAKPCCVALFAEDVAALVEASAFSGDCPAHVEPLLDVVALDAGQAPRVLLLREAPLGPGLGVSAALHLCKLPLQSLLAWPDPWLSRGPFQSVMVEGELATTLVLDSGRLVRRLRSLV